MEGMTRHVLVITLVAAALSGAAAPAAAQSRREMQMMADIRMLQEQTQQLQQQLAAALDQLNETLKSSPPGVDDQTAATRKSFADQKLAVDHSAATCASSASASTRPTSASPACRRKSRRSALAIPSTLRR